MPNQKQRTIMVTPDRLDAMAEQLRRSHVAMAELAALARRRLRGLDAEARSLLAVEELVQEAERIWQTQAPVLEWMVRFLEWKAEAFREADAGVESVVPAGPSALRQ